MTIREKETYRTDGYDTFEEYCQERWGWTARRANQLMCAAEVVLELKSGTIVPLPANEGQARELNRLREDPPAMRDLWNDLVAEKGGAVTARDIRQAVDERIGHVAAALPEPPKEPEHHYLARRLAEALSVTRYARCVKSSAHYAACSSSVW